MNAEFLSVMSAIEHGVPRKILGKNRLVKKVFEFFVNGSGEEVPGFILCAKSGLILSSFGVNGGGEIAGQLLNLKQIQNTEIKSVDFFYDYVVLLQNETEGTAIEEVLVKSSEVLEIFSENESEYIKLLKNLDYVDNAIMMCDTDCNITFANDNFCNNFNVDKDERDSFIGMNILDVIERNGIQITAVETDSSNLKMLEVIKSGKPSLDWPVRFECSGDPAFSKLVSNDMFPIFDEKHRVSGLVEISRSQRQELKKTRKYVGLNAEYEFDDVIGDSNLIRKRIKLAKDFAGNRGTVLITGESGVGKEIFAQAIHNKSARSNGPFVALNCANFPAELIESELFGYVEGAFTGASKKGQMGKFELANGGTLFLDEIGELPYYFQSKLLRVLETWTITRIGGLKEIPIDVRLIAATNRDLPKMIQEGLFRQDLYYRLQVLTLDLPPLRERAEDIPLIANHFLTIFAGQNGHAPKELSESAKAKLMSYPWPGNARELKNVMNRIDLLYHDQVITEDAIDFALFSKESFETTERDSSLEDRIDSRKKEIDAAYRKLLNEALDITKGNKKKAAELLGVSRKTFYRMIEKYQLK